MGFDQKRSIDALKQAKNNIDDAVVLLTSGCVLLSTCFLSLPPLTSTFCFVDTNQVHLDIPQQTTPSITQQGILLFVTYKQSLIHSAPFLLFCYFAGPSEDDIATVMSMGFSQEQATQALTATEREGEKGKRNI